MDDKLKTGENVEFLCGKFLKSGMRLFVMIVGDL